MLRNLPAWAAAAFSTKSMTCSARVAANGGRQKLSQTTLRFVKALPLRFC